MDKFENLQTSNEKDKKFYIPMEVTSETIRDFGINPEDIIWVTIGHRRCRVIQVPATEEQYQAFIRPLWNEDKGLQRHDTLESLDKLYADRAYEEPSSYDLEEEILKRATINTLYKVLDELEELDRLILTKFSEGYTETEIGQKVGMCQKAINKRKRRALLTLRTRLTDLE